MQVRVHQVIPSIAVFFIAIVISTNSQYCALSNQYMVNDDVRQHLYWMRQFADGDLFRDDLLTEYSKNFQPWGFIFLYWVLSPVVDPILSGKILTIILFSITAVYLFRLVEHLLDKYTGFFAAAIFMVTPTVLSVMSGGLSRTFGDPLLVAFIYYLVKNNHWRASVVLILQCLFYPQVFLLSSLTYVFTFLKIRIKDVSSNQSNSKVTAFLATFLICGALLGVKYILPGNPSFGKLVSKNQIINNPDFSEDSRVGNARVKAFVS